MKYIFSLLFICAVLTVSALSQNVLPVVSPTPVPEDDNSVIKIDTNLIQIDVTVTDSRGRIVTDLKPEEIEVFENNKKQQITNFSFIDQGTKTIETANPVKAGNNAAEGPVPPVQLRPRQVRRTFALVVDDLSLSFESIFFVRKALRKFVDEQMQPDDLVAIIRTGKGIGALQQFTSDKRMLYLAIDKIKASTNSNMTGLAAIGSTSGGEAVGADDDDTQGELDEFREDVFSVGTLGAINYVIKGMKTFPGRKSIILMSDGFSIRPRNGFESRVLDSLWRLGDMANRASVTISTVDARGLMSPELTAADSVSGMGGTQIMAALRQRRNKILDNQEGLGFLAKATGGTEIKNSNDLAAGIKTVLTNQSGYYLVGYEPDAAIFDAVKRRFNELTVKVKRPGVTVRYRSGFFGITDDELREKKTVQNSEQQILTALTSPFSTGDISLRLTPLFFRGEKTTSYVSSFVHVNAANLKFTDEADGWKKAVFDIVAVAFGDNGVVVDHIYRTETVRARGALYDKVLRDGFVYAVQFPVKKPGGYQMRVALRDTGTSKIGSANQFIEVPDVKKDRMFLSGMVFQQIHDNKEADVPEGVTTSETRQDTALRQFRQGTSLSYSLSIYNPQIDRATGAPQLKTQLNIYQDGKLLFAGKETDYQPQSGADAKNNVFSGAIELGAQMPPGDYVLQVVVTDMLAKKKDRKKAQWLDFEIVK